MGFASPPRPLLFLWVAALASACAGANGKAPALESTPVGRSVPVVPVVPVVPGENACQAAGRLGVSVDALLTANHLRQQPEQQLPRGSVAVPPQAPLQHHIRPGQTLGGVAAWYGLSTNELAQANGIAEPDRILAGERLRIPAGARTGCPPPPVVARAAVKRPVALPSTPPAPRAVAAVSAGPPAPRSAPRVAPGLPAEQLARVDDLLARASSRYDAADFRAVVALTRNASELLAARSDHPASVDRRARAKWLEGLALAGLDERASAVHSLREALALRPALRDDPSASPRILALLDAEDAEDASAR
jgi:LysM repeat protein